METCSSGDLLGDDQLDNLVNMLNYSPDAASGLDELLPSPSDALPDLDAFLKSEPVSLGEPRPLGFEHLNAARAGTSGLTPQFHEQQQQLEEDEQQLGGDAKRRRRIRNAKQQELNRLAQQRYRQRKKQKYTDLQVTVEELSSKMATIARLEGEAAELRKRETAATELATTRQAALLQAQVAIQSQALLIQQQQKTLRDQQQQLDTLTKTQLQLIQQQQQQQQQASAASAPAPAQRSSSPTPQQQQERQTALTDKLVEALRAALAEVCEEQGLHASSSAQEQVVLRFRRSVQVCYKDVLALATGTDAPQAASAQPQPQPQQAPTPTSATSQKPPEAARLLSIPCC